MAALEPGMHWPGAELRIDDSSDAEWDFVVPSDNEVDLDAAVSAFEEIEATRIQATVRGLFARKQAAVRPSSPPLSTPAASTAPPSRALSAPRGLAFLMCTAAALFFVAKNVLSDVLSQRTYSSQRTAPFVPALPYDALALAIDEGEVRALQLAQDPTDAEWRALALLHDRGQGVAVRVPPRSVAALLGLVKAHGVAFASPQGVALPPPSSAPPPVMLSGWLAPPSAPPLPPTLALALLHETREEGPSRTPRLLLGDALAEGLLDHALDLVLCLALAYAVHRLSKFLGAAAIARPSPAPPTPTTPVTNAAPTAAPLLSELTPTSPIKDFRAYVDAHTSTRVKATKLGCNQHRTRAHILRDLHAAEGLEVDGGLVPSRLFEPEKARLTWNELQRRTGRRGFTKAQMSLMWAAHKKGPITWRAFRSHCAGHGLSRADVSRMWAHHKLFAADLRAVPVGRA